MSQAKHQDKSLIERMLTEAVSWFHESRRHPENSDKDLLDLARECANGAFKNHVVLIPEARKEIVARKFMEACAERFSYEVGRAAAEKQAEVVH